MHDQLKICVANLAIFFHFHVICYQEILFNQSYGAFFCFLVFFYYFCQFKAYVINMCTRIRIYLTIILSFAVAAVGGQTITPEIAQKRAADFLTKKGKRAVALIHKPLCYDSLGMSAPLYVFNAPQGKGFVIVSGDDRAESILGYVDEGEFDEKEMPANMRAWLDGYVGQIRTLQKMPTVRKSLRALQRTPIAPLMSTKWGQGDATKQGSAYNKQCPTINGVHCLTGCVATAMAQVMNYYQWPEETLCEIPQYKSNNNVGTLAALPLRSFDWASMADKYKGSETSEEEDAVAWLMRYCGQALSTNYGTGSSSASTNSVTHAMRTYFGYDTNMRYVSRDDYSAEAWDNLIYTELSEHRPVIYRGVSSEFGHAFVCDGYDDNSLYHINWGGDGRYEGYYALSVLNPYQGGEGYTGVSDGFSMSQGAVVGIQPFTGEDLDDSALHVDYITYYSTKLYALFVNMTGETKTFEYGFLYHLANDDSGEFKYKKATSTFKDMNQKTYYFDVNSLKLADGVYRFYPYSRLSGSTEYHVNGNYKDYLQVTISGGAVKVISIHPKAKLAINTIECTGNKVVNMVQEVKVTVSNTGEEFNNLIYLFASKTTTKGEFVNKTGFVVGAGATAEAFLYFTPTSTGTWYLWADTDESGKGIAKRVKVTIRDLPTRDTSLELESCEVEAFPQATTVTVSVKNTGRDGYFRPLRCLIYSLDEEKYVGFAETSNLNISMSKTLVTKFSFEDLVFGQNYQAVLYDYVTHQSDNLERLGEPFDFTVNHSGLLGDVNDDGKVDISDVLMTVDYVLGRVQDTFVIKAADWDKNRNIDISDVLGIVDLILGKHKLSYY